MTTQIKLIFQDAASELQYFATVTSSANDDDDDVVNQLTPFLRPETVQAFRADVRATQEQRRDAQYVDVDDDVDDWDEAAAIGLVQKLHRVDRPDRAQQWSGQGEQLQQSSGSTHS